MFSTHSFTMRSDGITISMEEFDQLFGSTVLFLNLTKVYVDDLFHLQPEDQGYFYVYTLQHRLIVPNVLIFHCWHEAVSSRTRIVRNYNSFVQSTRQNFTRWIVMWSCSLGIKEHVCRHVRGIYWLLHWSGKYMSLYPQGLYDDSVWEKRPRPLGYPIFSFRVRRP